MNFHVGQKVRYIGNGEPFVTKGKTYEVVEDSIYYPSPTMRIAANANIKLWVFQKDFVLANEFSNEEVISC
jgi:hypothetical protein